MITESQVLLPKNALTSEWMSIKMFESFHISQYIKQTNKQKPHGYKQRLKKLLKYVRVRACERVRERERERETDNSQATDQTWPYRWRNRANAWYIHMEHSWTIRKNEIPILNDNLKELGREKSNEVSQGQEDKHHMISLPWYPKWLISED